MIDLDFLDSLKLSMQVIPAKTIQAQPVKYIPRKSKDLREQRELPRKSKDLREQREPVSANQKTCGNIGC